MAALAAVYDTPRAGRRARQRRRPGRAPCAAAGRRSRAAARSSSSPTSWATTSGRRRCGGLARHHQVVAVHVTDPRELELPAVGMLAVVDTETGRQRYVQTGSPALRARYAAAAGGTARARSCGASRGAGAEYLHLSTDRDWLADTVRFATGASRRLQRRRPASTGGRGRSERSIPAVASMTFLSAWRLCCSSRRSPSLVGVHPRAAAPAHAGAAVHQRGPAGLGGAAPSRVAAARPGRGDARRPRRAHARLRRSRPWPCGSPRTGRPIILALDTSASMTADRRRPEPARGGTRRRLGAS